MKLIFIRHAEPLYDNDSLTQKGFREAELLGKRAAKWNITQAYASPFGRAQATALPTLKAKGITLTHEYPEMPSENLAALDPSKCIVYPWLREFSVYVDPKKHPDNRQITWDLTPEYINTHPLILDRNHWWEDDLFQPPYPPRVFKGDGAKPVNLESDPEKLALFGTKYEMRDDIPWVKQEYDWVVNNFDRVLAQWGYERDGLYYKTKGDKEPTERFMVYNGTTIETIARHEAEQKEKGEEEVTLVFFCHLGVQLMILSHLLNVSPLVMHHGFFTAPSSVTVFSAEERKPGYAAFRCQMLGDTSHLLAEGEPVSYYGAFETPFQG